MNYEYEIRVPAIANSPEGRWQEPAHTGEQNWEGTAHALGREVLRNWAALAPDRYQGYPAIVEVRGEHGNFADIDDPTEPEDVVQEMESAIESHQIATLAADRTRDALAAAMLDVSEFTKLSANNISHRVRSVMSRPTALKVLRP